MGRDKDIKLAEARMLADAQNREAKKQNRARARSVRPWKVLREAWFEEVGLVFDVKIPNIPKWGPTEDSLSRKLITEVGLDQSVSMAKRFIDIQRNKDEMPSFRLFWATRGTLRAKVDGTVKPLDNREFDAEGAKKHPKIGW